MDLCAQAIVFVLRHYCPHFSNDGLGAGEPLGQLRVDRLAHLDIDGCYHPLCLFLLRVFPEGAGDESQVGDLVIGPLEQFALLGIVPSDLRQRIEYGRIADAHPQFAQQDAGAPIGHGG